MLNNIMKYVAIVLAVVFMVFGILVMTLNFFVERLPSQFRLTMGIVLILYGIFRIVSTYSKQKNAKI